MWTDLLRARGLRATSARIYVLAALQDHGHGTPEHVHEHTLSMLPGVNLSTIYRTLETLAEHGVVSHIHLAGPSATYMLAEHATHAHLVCRECETVYQLDDKITAKLAKDVATKHAFHIDGGHLAIFGHCDICPAKPAPHVHPSGKHTHH